MEVVSIYRNKVENKGVLFFAPAHAGGSIQEYDYTFIAICRDDVDYYTDVPKFDDYDDANKYADLAVFGPYIIHENNLPNDVYELDLSIRCFNYLKRHGISKVHEFLLHFNPKSTDQINKEIRQEQNRLLAKIQ